jgi:hypothetical protein
MHFGGPGVPGFRGVPVIGRCLLASRVFTKHLYYLFILVRSTLGLAGAEDNRQRGYPPEPPETRNPWSPLQGVICWREAVRSWRTRARHARQASRVRMALNSVTQREGSPRAGEVAGISLSSAPRRAKATRFVLSRMAFARYPLSEACSFAPPTGLEPVTPTLAGSHPSRGCAGGSAELPRALSKAIPKVRGAYNRFAQTGHCVGQYFAGGTPNPHPRSSPAGLQSDRTDVVRILPSRVGMAVRSQVMQA